MNYVFEAAVATLIGFGLGSLPLPVDSEMSPAPGPCPACQPQGGAFDVAGQAPCNLTVNLQNLGSSSAACERYFDSCLPINPDQCYPVLGFSIQIPAGSTIDHAWKWGGGNQVPVQNGVISIGIQSPVFIGCGLSYTERYSLRDKNNVIVCVMDLTIACTMCSEE